MLSNISKFRSDTAQTNDPTIFWIYKNYNQKIKNRFIKFLIRDRKGAQNSSLSDYKLSCDLYENYSRYSRFLAMRKRVLFWILVAFPVTALTKNAINGSKEKHKLLGYLYKTPQHTLNEIYYFIKLCQFLVLYLFIFLKNFSFVYLI